MNHQQEIDQLVSDSGYLTEAARRAATTTEAEARATRAQSVFLTVVKTASEMTTVGLPEGKTVAEALERATARKEFLWRQDMDEEDRIAALLRYCTSLYRGNETAGQLLASAAIWS